MMNNSVLQLAREAGLPITRFPQTNQEADLAEELMTKACDHLTMEEHEKILFDVHGVGLVEDDDPAAIDLKLNQLDETLNNLPTNEAYLQAKCTNEKYVSNRKFRLMFLRHEKFNVNNAAKLIASHFDIKRELFGDGDILGRDIRQSDLSSKDRVILESGFTQVLPMKDAAGRTLLLLSMSQMSKFPKDGWELSSEYRVIWYLIMKSLLDVETQKKGCVWIFKNIDGCKVTAEHIRKMSQVRNAIPSKFVGGHLCYSNPELRPFVTGVALLSSEQEQIRFRSHCGTPEQIDFELQMFGIPSQLFPVQKDGSCCTKKHCQWLALLRSQEAAEEEVYQSIQRKKKKATTAKEVSLIKSLDEGERPRRFDVLFGRSRQAREHTGTQRAYHIVEMHFETYEKIGRWQKTEVAEKIVSLIHEAGGRFLRQDGKGSWVLTDDAEARKKVAHWFRHMRHQRPGNNDFGETKRRDESDKKKIVSPLKAFSNSRVAALRLKKSKGSVRNMSSELAKPLHLPRGDRFLREKHVSQYWHETHQSAMKVISG